VSTAAERLARQVKTASSLEEVRTIADRVLASARRAKPSAPTIPGKSREERRAEEDAAEAKGKAAAYARAGRTLDREGRVDRDAWCEYVDRGARCAHVGVAADHVIGGAHKGDMEGIGAEGFQILCVVHNDLKTRNAPSRSFWLDQAEEHALRVGARRLLFFIGRARAKLEGKRLGKRAVSR
jgi:hypothetical protein